jgi:hypothetical protein
VAPSGSPKAGSAASSARTARSGNVNTLAPVKTVTVTGAGDGQTIGQ